MLWPGHPIAVPLEGGIRLVHPPGFDAFKFLVWFVIPFFWLLLSRPGTPEGDSQPVRRLGRIDPGYFSWTGWRGLDWGVLAGLVLAGLAAVLSVLAIPGLRGYYPSLGAVSTADKWHYLAHMVVYTFSWVVGWEFLHRYALLKTVQARWPSYGWLMVPAMEAVYHLTKHPSEAAGMLVYGLFLTWWARSRQNTLLPFLAHLVIELELMVFMVVV